MTKFVRPILSTIFVIILILQYYVFINQDNNTKMVFSESNNNINDYSNYLIDFENTLNSKNFNDKFSILEKNKYEIKKLYINVKENWNNKFKTEINEYSFDNLDNFISHYKNTLKEYNMIDEIPNIDISGININKVLIYTSKENIEKLSREYNLQYQKK